MGAINSGKQQQHVARSAAEELEEIQNLQQALADRVTAMTASLKGELMESLVVEGGTLAVRPAFCRMPAVGKCCPWTGLHRARIVELCREEEKVSWFKDPETSQNGVVFYHLASLEEWCRGEMERQREARKRAAEETSAAA